MNDRSLPMVPPAGPWPDNLIGLAPPVYLPPALARLAEMAAQLRAMDERLTRLELEVADYRTRDEQ